MMRCVVAKGRGRAKSWHWEDFSTCWRQDESTRDVIPLTVTDDSCFGWTSVVSSRNSRRVRVATSPTSPF